MLVRDESFSGQNETTRHWIDYIFLMLMVIGGALTLAWNAILASAALWLVAGLTGLSFF